MPLGSWTPLMYAARENALEAGRALVERQSRPRTWPIPTAPRRSSSPSSTPTTTSRRCCSTPGADPNVVDKDAAMGPLYAAMDMHRLAVGHGTPEPEPSGALDAVDIVRRLLDRRADPKRG